MDECHGNVDGEIGERGEGGEVIDKDDEGRIISLLSII